MFALPHVLNLLMHEFAGSGGGRLAFPQVLLGTLDSCFRWHSCLLSQGAVVPMPMARQEMAWLTASVGDARWKASRESV